jgi:hypothetical protein
MVPKGPAPEDAIAEQKTLIYRKGAKNAGKNNSNDFSGAFGDLGDE